MRHFPARLDMQPPAKGDGIKRVHIPTARRAGELSYNYGDWPDHVVYIGRRWPLGGYNLPASPWANPYGVRRYGREEAIRLYREHVEGELLGRLGELEGKTLACWCDPDEPCHGDVLMELVLPRPAALCFSGSASYPQRDGKTANGERA